MAGTAPGKKVTVRIIRDGKKQALDLTISELPADTQKFRGELNNLLRGVRIQGLTPELKKQLDIPKRITGVVVSDIEDSSPAADRIMANDVIIEINRNKINSSKDYETIVSHIKSGEDVLLLIYRHGTSTFITLSAR